VQDQAVEVGKPREELARGHEKVEVEPSDFERGGHTGCAEGEVAVPPFDVLVRIVANDPNEWDLRIKQVPEDLGRAGPQHDGKAAVVRLARQIAQSLSPINTTVEWTGAGPTGTMAVTTPA
jgi:hypothetical protein